MKDESENENYTQNGLPHNKTFKPKQSEMTIKTFLLLPFFLSTALSFSQTAKEDLFKQDIAALVEEMEFMYGYDQLLREYIIFKTFNKSETDRIETLPDSLQLEERKNRKFLNDTLSSHIYRNYINPKDVEHTDRMIAIVKKYGFPGVKRIRQYYDKEFDDPEFSPYILLVHAPQANWEELKELMKKELEESRIDRCTYGHLLWHFTGRKSFQPMLDNGYVLEEKNGRKVLSSTCD